jgi:6-phosphogluconolactonase
MRCILKLVTRRAFIIGLASAPIVARRLFAAPVQSHLLFVGTNTGGKSASTGIYAFRWEPNSGSLFPLGLAAETASPAYMAISPNGRHVYAVNEISEYNGSKTGSVSAFTLNRAAGTLVLENMVSSGGMGPCNIAVDHTGKAVFVADGAGGSLASYRVLSTGGLSEPVSNFHFPGHSVNPKRQMHAYTHCTVISPDNRYLIVNDLGLDRITTFRFDADTAVLTPNAAPSFQAAPGSGPRNFTFHPNARWAYSVNEMGNTLDALAWESRLGTLTGFQHISTLPPNFSGENIAATVRVESTGRFLYVSNRGANSIAVFSIDPLHGTLRPIQQISCGGETPRYFSIDPTNRWLLVGNQDSATIVVFARNSMSGLLSATNTLVKVDSPMFLLFV